MLLLKLFINGLHILYDVLNSTSPYHFLLNVCEGKLCHNCQCPVVTVCSVIVNYGEETLGISCRNENLSFLPLGVQSQRNS